MLTPESPWWPLCWVCLHSGRPRKVELFETSEQGHSVVFTAHCHGETEACSIPLADARRMLGEAAGDPMIDASSRLAPGMAFPSIAFRPAGTR